MESTQRLTAKAALRLPCFKDLRTKDAVKPPQPERHASDKAEQKNSKNAAQVASGSPDLGMPPKVPKDAVDDWGEAETTSPARSEKVPKSKAHAGAAEGLPSIGAAPAPAAAQALQEDPAHLRRQKLQQDSFVKTKDLRSSQENFGAKRKESIKKDFRLTQESFGGAKGGLRTPLEEEPMPCEESFEDFQSSSHEASRPAPVQHRSTPQAVDYRLPWENAPGSMAEDFGVEATRTPTPTFGNKSHSKGFFAMADPRRTGGAAGPTTKKPVATVGLAEKGRGGGITMLPNLGVRESRWSGA